MALFLFIIIDIHLYYMSEAYEKSFADCYKINKESLKNYENQIERIENAIEFFQSSSEEEVQKYLSYKMGDSKKINQLYLVFFASIRYNNIYRFGSD